MSNLLSLVKIQKQLKTTLADINRRPMPLFDASELQAQIDDLQAQINALGVVDASLQSQIDAINLTLTTIQNEINIIVAGSAIYEVRTVTADTANSATRAWDTVWCDCTAGDITVTLTPLLSQIINITKTDNTANTVIIVGVGGELINGAASKSILYQWTSVKLQSDGVQFIAQ